MYPGRRGYRAGDKWIYEQIKLVAPRTTLIAIVTKIDKVSKERVAEQLLSVSQLVGPEVDIVPVSAVSGAQVEVLTEVLASSCSLVRRSIPMVN